MEMRIETMRRWRHGTTAVLLTLLVVSASVLAFVLLDRRHFRLDLTEHREQSLAPQTKAVLKDLAKELKIMALFRRGDDLDQVYIRRKVDDILREFASRSPKINYQMVD